MSFSSIDIFFFHNNRLEDKVIDFRSIGCMCNLPTKKITNNNRIKDEGGDSWFIHRNLSNSWSIYRNLSIKKKGVWIMQLYMFLDARILFLIYEVWNPDNLKMKWRVLFWHDGFLTLVFFFLLFVLKSVSFVVGIYSTNFGLTYILAFLF